MIFLEVVESGWVDFEKDRNWFLGGLRNYRWHIRKWLSRVVPIGGVWGRSAPVVNDNDIKVDIKLSRSHCSYATITHTDLMLG